MDFRAITAVEAFITHVLTTYSRLDVIINNATQTVRRPPAYYQHLLDDERKGAAALSAAAAEPLMLATAAAPKLAGDTTTPVRHIGNVHEQMAVSAAMSQLPLVTGDDGRDNALFPKDMLDHNGQQVRAAMHRG